MNDERRWVLPQATQALALAEAQRIVAQADGVLAVVVATADGFDVASAARGALQPSRVAALASSIAAIGEVVSAEAGLGRGTSVTVNTDRGFAVAQAIPRPDVSLVLFAIAGPDALLGSVNYITAESARRLAQP